MQPINIAHFQPTSLLPQANRTPAAMTGNSLLASAQPQLAQSISAQPFSAMNMLMQVMQMMVQMLQMFMGQQQTPQAPVGTGGGMPPASDLPANPLPGAGVPPVSDSPGTLPPVTGAPVTGNPPGSVPPVVGNPPPQTIPGYGTPSGGTPPSNDIPGYESPTGGQPPAGDIPGYGSPPYGNPPVYEVPDSSTPPPPAGGGGQPGSPDQPGQPDFPASSIDPGLNWLGLSVDERTEMGQNPTQRAISHLGGRQLLSTGSFSDTGQGHIYNNVLSAGSGFTAEEKRLVQMWTEQEMAQDGFVSGRRLQEEFMGLYSDLVDTDLTTRYGAQSMSPVSSQSVNITNDVNALQQRTGFTEQEQQALRLGGHDPLFGGQIDGQYLLYSLGNANSLDSGLRAGAGNDSDQATEALLKADLIDDGAVNGSSTRRALLETLDKAMGVGQGISSYEQIQQQAETIAVQNGRTVGQIAQDVQQGMTKALNTASQFVKEHPIASTAGAASLLGATAICPFMGGLAAGAAGIAAASNMVNGKPEAANAV